MQFFYNKLMKSAHYPEFYQNSSKRFRKNGFPLWWNQLLPYLMWKLRFAKYLELKKMLLSREFK